MKRILVCLAMVMAPAYGAASELAKDLRMNVSGGVATIELRHDSKAKFRVREIKDFDQVVVEAVGLQLPARFTKTIDSSSAESPVAQVTPYNAGGKSPTVKLVIQLRGKASVVHKDSAGRFVLSLASLRQNRMEASATGGKGSRKGAKDVVLIGDEVAMKDAAPTYSESVKVAKQLIETLETEQDKRAYKGSKVMFEAKDADIHNIFRLVGETSGLNIVTSTEIKGTITVSLKEVPWDQLLDIVLQQHHLRADAVGNVVHIVTGEEYRRREEERRSKLVKVVQKKALTDELEPTIMAIIPVSFAKASALQAMIDKLLYKYEEKESKMDEERLKKERDKLDLDKQVAELQNRITRAENMGQKADVGKIVVELQKDDEQEIKVKPSFVRGKIEVDERSNSLIVTNTKEAVERIRRLVKELDVPLPQVLIDAKIVVAKDEWSRGIGVSWGGKASNRSSGRQGIGVGFNGGAVTLGADSGSSSFSVSGGKGGGFGAGFQIGAGTHGNLNLALSLGETTGQSKTIASPRLVVNNKQSATVSDGTTLNFFTAGGSGSAGTVQQVSAALSLNVTPQVTNSGAVLLDLTISKSAPTANRDIESKSLTTQVLVEGGSTLVLGGIYNFHQSADEKGIPLLKDLPFVGQLFRTNVDLWEKSELMVFVTPQILEPSESGAPKL
ncbi:MAG: type IV pilus secretin PilQ [Bdellovibrionales bacterium]|nr:type IV pilus secretin PilQ [Bdellovibrionales bacterium]